MRQGWFTALAFALSDPDHRRVFAFVASEDARYGFVGYGYGIFDVVAGGGSVIRLSDAMDGTARRAQIFRLGAAPQGVLRLVDVLQRMMGVLAEAVGRLKKGDDVIKYCVEAKQLEEEGDSIYHEALGQLFEKERDAIELIKWKEIYDNLEGTLDQAEDVANVVESITIKHA